MSWKRTIHKINHIGVTLARDPNVVTEKTMVKQTIECDWSSPREDMCCGHLYVHESASGLPTSTILDKAAKDGWVVVTDENGDRAGVWCPGCVCEEMTCERCEEEVDYLCRCSECLMRVCGKCPCKCNEPTDGMTIEQMKERLRNLNWIVDGTHDCHRGNVLFDTIWHQWNRECRELEKKIKEIEETKDALASS